MSFHFKLFSLGLSTCVERRHTNTAREKKGTHREAKASQVSLWVSVCCFQFNLTGIEYFCLSFSLSIMFSTLADWYFISFRFAFLFLLLVVALSISLSFINIPLPLVGAWFVCVYFSCSSISFFTLFTHLVRSFYTRSTHTFQPKIIRNCVSSHCVCTFMFECVRWRLLCTLFYKYMRSLF